MPCAAASSRTQRMRGRYHEGQHGKICQPGIIPIAPGCHGCTERHGRRRYCRGRHLHRCRLRRSCKSGFGRGTLRLLVSRGSMQLLGCQQTDCHSFFAQEPAGPAAHAIDAMVPAAARRPGRSGLCPALVGRGFGKARSLRELPGWGSANCCINRLFVCQFVFGRCLWFGIIANSEYPVWFP